MESLALVPLLTACLFAADTLPAGLTVHEWGTFTSVAGADGTAVDWDALGCKTDLPTFVNERTLRAIKWRLTGTVRMETPVLYFYSSRELDAHVKVGFPRGVITEWYPNADLQILQQGREDGIVRPVDDNLNGIDTTLQRVTGSIEWKSVKVQPDATPAFPVEQAANRYYAARATEASPVAVGHEHEKFLFYRGVGRFPAPLSARVADDGTVTVENVAPEPVPFLILFEKHEDGSLGYRVAGGQDVSLAPPTLNGSFAQLQHDLEAALVAQGLYPKEAQAMVDTWRDSWFETGSRLIYIVPSRSVDAILPLEIEPAPEQTARVFVGRIELITPETIRTVRDAVANDDAATLDANARFLAPILQRIHDPALAAKIRLLRSKLRQELYSGNCR